MFLTRAVKHLIIINVIFFVLSLLIKDFKMLTALWFFENQHFQWWQIVSHMFMHADAMHIFFNMFALASFGPVLESYFGSNRFVWFYFLCGLGAALLHTGINYFEFQKITTIIIENGYSKSDILSVINQGKFYENWRSFLSETDLSKLFSVLNTPAVGASGAIYGVLVAFGFICPNAELSLMFLPIPIRAKYFIPILILLDLFSGFTGFSIFGANIAHFAHIGGALAGFILMRVWRKNSFDSHRLY